MYACVYVLPFLCDFACVLCFQHICLSEQLYFQNTELKCITWKNNHLSALSISLCKFCKRNILTKLLPLLNCRRLSLTVCCWSLLVRTDVCTADFGITLVTFSPREKPGIVILNLSRPLLHRYEPFWLSTLALLQQWAIWKSCFYTWVSTSINSNIITPSLFSCPIILYLKGRITIGIRIFQIKTMPIPTLQLIIWISRMRWLLRLSYNNFAAIYILYLLLREAHLKMLLTCMLMYSPNTQLSVKFSRITTHGRYLKQVWDSLERRKYEKISRALNKNNAIS